MRFPNQTHVRSTAILMKHVSNMATMGHIPWFSHFPSPTITGMHQIAGTAQSYDWMVYPPINTASGRCPCLENCSVYTRAL